MTNAKTNKKIEGIKNKLAKTPSKSKTKKKTINPIKEYNIPIEGESFRRDHKDKQRNEAMEIYDEDSSIPTECENPINEPVEYPWTMSKAEYDNLLSTLESLPNKMETYINSMNNEQTKRTNNVVYILKLWLDEGKEQTKVIKEAISKKSKWKLFLKWFDLNNHPSKNLN